MPVLQDFDLCLTFTAFISDISDLLAAIDIRKIGVDKRTCWLVAAYHRVCILVILSTTADLRVDCTMMLVKTNVWTV